HKSNNQRVIIKMARSDFAALRTQLASEYIAYTELQRFGLRPYLPQHRKRHMERGIFLIRRYPLFPTYLLIPINDAHAPAVRVARGLLRTDTLLADQTGKPWRCPHDIIDALRQSEERGDFDEMLTRGDHVRLRQPYGVLSSVNAVLADKRGNRAELLL